MNIHCEYEGIYDLSITNTETGEVRKYEFQNLITNNGLDLLNGDISDISTILNYCRLGTGSTTPTFTDTNLAAPLTDYVGGGTLTYTSQTTTSPYYVQTSRSYVYAQGAVVGNISELGVFRTNNPTSPSMFSRSLIKDSGGNPTTITVTAIEQLTVIYRLRTYFTQHQRNSGTIEVVYNSVTTNYNYTLYHTPITVYGTNSGSFHFYGLGSGYTYSAYTFTPAVSPVTYPTGNTIGIVGAYVTRGAYTTGTFNRDITLSFPPNAANHASGVAAVGFCTSAPGGGVDYFKYHIHFTPSIPKTNTDTLTIRVNVSWGRYAG